MNTSQRTLILRHLAQGKSITKREAILRFDCYNLPGRIYDIRKERHDVKTEMVKGRSGKYHAEYRIPKACRGNHAKA